MKSSVWLAAPLMLACVGCAIDKSDFARESIINKQYYNAPPAAMMARPGPMVDGPGPGVLPIMHQEPVQQVEHQVTQIKFLGPEGMSIGWQIGNGFAENQLTAPNHYNFHQGSTYRLKFAGIPDHDALVIYPTLMVYPTHPRSAAYLMHTNVVISLSDEDLAQVESNNFVTKVVYLPDPEHQDLAIAGGFETLVSTQLDPGVDPVAEADRLGTILAVLRMGNMDLEAAPGAPATARGPDGELAPVSYLDGDKGETAAPVPIGSLDGGVGGGVPNAIIMGMPGRPGYGPIAGVGQTPYWGMTTTGTPIGLPGPPHLPYGGPASLRSHTVRNLTRQDLGRPVDHFLLDVKHKPGYRLPHPVKHVIIEETHPQFDRPLVDDGSGEYCPPY